MSDIFLGEPRYSKNLNCVASAEFRETFGNRRSGVRSARKPQGKAISSGLPFPALVRRLRRLPIVHKTNYRAGFLQFLQELTHGFRLPGQEQTGPDIGQRLQNKLSQLQPRMRQLQSLTFNFAVPAVEQVNVDRSRGIFWMITSAAQCFLD